MRQIPRVGPITGIKELKRQVGDNSLFVRRAEILENLAKLANEQLDRLELGENIPALHAQAVVDRAEAARVLAKAKVDAKKLLRDAEDEATKSLAEANARVEEMHAERQNLRSFIDSHMDDVNKMEERTQKLKDLAQEMLKQASRRLQDIAVEQRAYERKNRILEKAMASASGR
jgi:chromosome segregation ATPase